MLGDILCLCRQVLETCVKNCGFRFHIKIAQRDFLSDLMRVIQQKVSSSAVTSGHVRAFSS